METKQTINNGPAAAAILAAGIGSFAFGLAVCLSQAINAVANFFTLSVAVGPLSGKTTAPIIVWLVSWIILSLMWKNRQVSFGKVFIAALLMIALGLLGTFPLFYDML
jgi:hypothetical protein